MHNLTLPQLFHHPPYSATPPSPSLSLSISPSPLPCQYILTTMQCSTFSTSSLLQFLHTLPSLLTPRHLPVSTSNTAVPPLNCTRTLLLHLHFTSTHRASYPFSINFCTSANFEWLFASSFQLSIASLHATSLSICLTSLIDKLFNPSARNPSHPSILKHFFSKSCLHRTPSPNSITCIITCFSSLSSPILITFNQNSIHLFIPSHFSGKVFSSNRRDTLGCSLSTPKYVYVYGYWRMQCNMYVIVNRRYTKCTNFKVGWLHQTWPGQYKWASVTRLQGNNPHPAIERTVTLTTASLYLLLLKPQVFYLGWIQKQPVIQQLPSVRHTDEAQQGWNSCLWLFHLCSLDDWGGNHWLP